MFLYYLPGISTAQITESLLADRGLDTVFRDLHVSQLGTSGVHANGPDGSSGCMIWAPPVTGELPFRAGHYPGEQNWTRIGSGRELWIGQHRQHPPNPDTLRRKHRITGYDEVLGDGRSWHCPTIRSCVETCRLPMVYELDAETDGWRRSPRPEYRDVWDASNHWQPLFESVDDWTRAADWLAHRDDMSETERLEAVTLCLGLNYRVGRREIGLLGLANSDEALPAIIDAAIDYPFLLEIAADPQKKTLLDSRLRALRPFWPGPEDSTAATDPVAAN